MAASLLVAGCRGVIDIDQALDLPARPVPELANPVYASVEDATGGKIYYYTLVMEPLGGTPLLRTPGRALGPEVAAGLRRHLLADFRTVLTPAVWGEVPAGKVGMRVRVLSVDLELVASFLPTYVAATKLQVDLVDNRGPQPRTISTAVVGQESRFMWLGPLSGDEALRASIAAAYSNLASLIAGEVVRQAAQPLAPGAAPAASPPQQPLVDAPPEIDVAPQSRTRRPAAWAVVIGIERYGQNVPAADFSRRDAEAFKAYAISTLGIPADQILTLVDEKATLANIRTALEGRLPRRLEAGKSEVFVFYSGHGVPDLRTRAPYLVPVDGDPAFPETSCYPLSSLYRALDEMGAKSATVFLDACFSGGAGRSGATRALLAGARPLLVQLNQAVVPPSVSVIASSTGEQVSSGLPAKQHGIFTYYLLKGLAGEADADTDRKVTMGEIDAFLVKHVSRAAFSLNREQTPQLLGGPPDRVLVQY